MTAVPTGLLRRATDRLGGTTLGRLAVRTFTGVVRIEVFDRAMTLAAQAFTSVLPIIVTVVAFNPTGADALAEAVSDELGLPAEAAAVVETTLEDATAGGGGLGLLGLLIILLSATSFSRALERMYLRVWEVPRPGLRTAWRWLATVLAISLTVLLISLTDRVVEGLPLGTLLDLGIAFVLWTVVWTIVPSALMARQVPSRSLWATGVATAAAIAIVSVAGAVYLPIALSSGARQFGAIGVSIAYIGWLFVLGFAVVVAAVVGRAAAVDEGRLGAVVRGQPR